MGRVAAPHGVRGMVKVVPWSQDPAALIAHKVWWLSKPPEEGWRQVEVKSAQLRGTALLAELAGVGSREAAASLRGSEVSVPRATLVAPAPNEHYWADLEGMDVVSRSGMRMGRVMELMESGAHPLLRVVDESGAERLIPFVAAHIDRVDADARRIDVDWEADF
jgi:16S rRNA processing protein RimM